MEVRRNIYESNGKDTTPAEGSKKAATNGESTNGTAEHNLEDSLKEQAAKKHCNTCGADCSREYWHYTGPDAKIDVCPPCLKNGEVGKQYRTADFVQIRNTDSSLIPSRIRKWTDEEELLLLEALEMYDDDWGKIADYVGTRTREECVNHFLQVTIEDEYLEPELPANALGYLGEKDRPVPFSEVQNPVLSVMTFLAGLVDPSVASAAVGRSVAETEKAMRQRIEAAKSEKGKDKDSEGGAVQESTDAMEIEHTTTTTTTTTTRLTALQTATTLPFAMAASRANALASHEERTLTRLVHIATNLQLQKLHLKMQQFSELEHLLKLERKDLERRRQALFLDRLEFQRRMRSVEETFGHAVQLSPVEGQKLVRETVRSAVSSGSLGIGRNGEQDEAEVKPLGEEAKVLSI
jgi:SWI/SNF related-matrix-associated actin-dependent regulator of chromatin subfamily C